jgi:hypothetical protein
MKTMKKTMKEIDVAALSTVVGGRWSQNKKIMAWTVFDGIVSAVGAGVGGWALWREYNRKE